MKTAVQIGAGNIGRGFMGQLLFEAGYRTVFVEAQGELVDKLNAAEQYPLRLLGAYSKQEIDMTISNIRADCSSIRIKARQVVKGPERTRWTSTCARISWTRRGISKKGFTKT